MLKLFEKKLSTAARAMCALIGQTPLFVDLTQSELALLLPHIYTRNYKQKEPVLYRGDPAQALYFVRSGKLCTYLDEVLDREVLAYPKAGDSVGHNAVLEKAVRLFNTEVVSKEATLLVLPQDPWLSVMATHPRMRSCVMHRFAELNNNRLKRLLDYYSENAGFLRLSKAEVM